MDEKEIDKLLASLLDSEGKLDINKLIAALPQFDSKFQREIKLYLERLGIFEREERTTEENLIREFLQIRIENKITENKAYQAYLNSGHTDTPELQEELHRTRDVLGTNANKGRSMVESRVRTASWPIIVKNQSVLLQVCLPRQDQGDYQSWEVKNGESTVQLTAGSKPDKHNRLVPGKLPWGKFPRLLLFYINVRVNSHHWEKDVFLGHSIGQFFDKIGLSRQGYTYDSFYEQLERLVRCGLAISYRYEDTGFPDAEIYPFSKDGSRTNYHRMSSQIDEFRDRDNQGAIKLKLDDSFYQSMIDNPLHIDLESIRALGKNMLAMDIFAMLAERLPAIEENVEEEISRDYLIDLFGSGQEDRGKFFRESFKSALQLVHEKAYKTANYRLEKHRLVLLRSPPANEVQVNLPPLM